jgi:hypothetical protein
MPSEAFTNLRRSLETQRTVVWLALLAAIPLYVFVTYVQFGPMTWKSGVFSHPFAIPLAVLAVIAAVAARVLPPMLLPKDRVLELLTRDPHPPDVARDPRTGAVDSDRLSRIRALPPEEQRLLAVAQASFGPFIVRLALHESIALYGLVLAFLSKESLPIVPFAAAALLLNLTVSPRLDDSAI